MNVRYNTAVPVVMHAPRAPDMGRLAALPHRDSLVLDADDSAAWLARRRIARCLPEWSLPEFTDAAWAVGTELVTNSVAATRAVQWTATTPPVRLSLHGGAATVALLAWDASVTAPAPRRPGPDDENGRGLAIVGELSAAWGYYHPADTTGKVTWAIIESP